MILHSVEDFIVSTLSVLDSLGGEASLAEIENRFHKRYAQALDPSVDWDRVTANHKKPLWADYCGSRVASRFLKPEGYIVVESHGALGSIWKLTDKGRAMIKEKQ